MKNTKAKQEFKRVMKRMEREDLADALKHLKDSYSYYHGVLLRALDSKQVNLKKELEAFPAVELGELIALVEDFRKTRNDAIDVYRQCVVNAVEDNRREKPYTKDERTQLKTLLSKMDSQLDDVYKSDVLEHKYAEVALIRVSEARRATRQAFKEKLNAVFEVSPEELKHIMIGIITDRDIRAKDIESHLPQEVGDVGRKVLTSNMKRLKAKFNAVHNSDRILLDEQGYRLLSKLVSNDQDAPGVEFKHLRPFFQSAFVAKQVGREGKVTEDQKAKVEELLEPLKFLADHTVKQSDYNALVAWYLKDRHDLSKDETGYVGNIEKKKACKKKWSDDRTPTLRPYRNGYDDLDQLQQRLG